ncbi:NAD-dependent succinate-semialdehyde dehydrogenase [Klebsiella pneumoniae]
MSTSQIALLASVQQFLYRQHGLYIDGAPCAAQSENRLTVWDPATGQAIATTADASPADVDRAVMSAWRAFVDRRWAGRTPADRERILLRFADLVEQHGEELAQLETLEQGKSIAISRAFEVGCTLNWMRYTAGLTTKISGRTLDVSIPFPQGARYQAWTKKEPVGVVAGIVPWNFPLMIGMWKVMPALAAGCSIVIKPSETTPLTLLRVAELATQAGIPDGVFNVVTGSAGAVGGELTSNPLVRKLSFTGSTEIGRQLMEQCAKDIKKVSLELGGNAPFIVFDDADLDKAVEGALASKFRNAGQTCVCANRLYVQDGVYDRFAEKLQQAVEKLRIGDGLQDGVTTGPLIDEKAVAKVEEHIADAIAKGAKVVTGGKPHALGGNFFQPTILVNVPDSAKVAKEETFGPLAPLFRFKDEADVIAQANDTEFGLAAYFYARDLSRVFRVGEALEYGIIGINTGIISTEVAPFGGVKASGLGREGSKYGIEDYLEIKYMCIGL